MAASSAPAISPVFIDQLGEILRRHGLNVAVRPVADDTPVAAVRNALAANLERTGDFVIINYSRSALGQPPGGHISPLAAYDRLSDSFLLLDVNPTRAGWVWIPTEMLISAMRTFDTVENRGYLLISEAAAADTGK